MTRDMKSWVSQFNKRFPKRLSGLLDPDGRDTQKLDKESVEAFQEIVQKLADYVFGTMSDGAPWCEVDLVDRTEGWRPPFLPVPSFRYLKKQFPDLSEEKIAYKCLDIASFNLKCAQDNWDKEERWHARCRRKEDESKKNS